jgi:hypothetical protein
LYFKVVEELESRFNDEQIEEILSLVRDSLAPEGEITEATVHAHNPEATELELDVDQDVEEQDVEEPELEEIAAEDEFIDETIGVRGREDEGRDIDEVDA